jgi:nitronate monooxygenase
MTAPIRAEARRTGDAELLNLWAGQAHELAEEIPAGDLVRKLDAEARAAIAAVSARLDTSRSID